MVKTLPLGIVEIPKVLTYLTVHSLARGGSEIYALTSTLGAWIGDLSGCTTSGKNLPFTCHVAVQ